MSGNLSQSAVDPAANQAAARTRAGYVRISSLLLSAAAALTAVVLVALLVRVVVGSTIPFDTDEANHAVDGWQVYWAASRGQPGTLVRVIADQAFYPPVHSFAVAAAYAVLGPSLAASRLPSVVMFALALLLLAGLSYRIAARTVTERWLTPWLPLNGASCALLLALSSQVFVVLAVLVMLEMTGAVVALLLLFAVDAADLAASSRRRSLWLVLAAGLAAASFLTKYSFGLFFVPGLLAGLVSAQVPWRAGRRAWREAAGVLLVIGLVGGSWLLMTDRPTMLLFFTDHPEYVPRGTLDNLAFYPRAWLQNYSPNPAMGMVVAALAIWGLLQQWRWLVVRVAAWSIAAGAVVLTVSTTNEFRHMLPLAPPLWLLAGLGVVTLLWRLRSRGGVAIAGATLGLTTLLLVSAYRPLQALPSHFTTEFEGDPVYSEVQAFALDQIALDEPTLFIGDFTDQNGLLALRWLAASTRGRPLDGLTLDYFPFEHHEHSLIRTNRKPQIATVDPSFPRQYMNEILAREYYTTIVEIKHLESYYGPRAANPEDPLCGYPTRAQEFARWIVIIYAVDAPPSPCTGA